jgi:hypothetical protein
LIGGIAALIGLLQRELVSLWHAQVMPEERLLNRYRRNQPTFLVLACFRRAPANIKVRNSSRMEIA